MLRPIRNKLLDRRVGHLVRRRYTKERVGYRDVLPETVKNGSSKRRTIDYILDRTLMRPRDVIQFFNECVKLAGGKEGISVETIRHAEGNYSEARRRSLGDEFRADYPNLLSFAQILKARCPSFTLCELGEQECVDYCMKVLEASPKAGPLEAIASKLLGDSYTGCEARRDMVMILYHVGLVGLKLEPHEPVLWSFEGKRRIFDTELEDHARVHVHAAFHRVLGIKPR